MITLVLGVIMGGAAWIGGAPVTGAVLFGLMVVTTIGEVEMFVGDRLVTAQA